MKLFCLMVTRNEADRYLQKNLWNHFWRFDAVFLYDDQSTDTTVPVANANGATVVVRPDGVPSFVEHEGKFRAEAWLAFEERMSPCIDDWVFVLDADEFIVTEDKGSLYDAASRAQSQGFESVQVSRPEIFHKDDWGHLYRRVDGYWKDSGQPRFFRYQLGGTFRDRPMGSGCVPLYAEQNPYMGYTGINLLHFGYLTEADRQEKYERYMKLGGHNPLHIESILARPQLEQWIGPVPLI